MSRDDEIAETDVAAIAHLDFTPSCSCGRHATLLVTVTACCGPRSAISCDTCYRSALRRAATGRAMRCRRCFAISAISPSMITAVPLEATHG